MTLAAVRSVTPAQRLGGRLALPADKSIGHRALIFGALSGGPARIAMRSPGRDLLSTVDCLRALGVSVSEDGDRYVVEGRPSRDAVLDCGNSGTTMRLLAGAVAGMPLTVTLDGDASLRARPMERAASLLRAAGADVTTTEGRAPMRVRGREQLDATTHRLPVPSAQLIGCAALAGLAADGETRIESPGPTRDHTERLLAFAGVPIRREGRTTIANGPAWPRPFELEVPGDPSAAAAWLVAGSLHPDAEITLTGVCLNPSRTAFVAVLRRMGADISVELTSDEPPEPIGDMTVRSSSLRAVSVDDDEVADLIDELPLLGIAMAAADGQSEVRDAGELRVKESDRVAAVVRGLAAIGANVEELPDGWRVRRGRPRQASVTTDGDHRIAIAFAVAALTGVAEEIELDDPGCVDVSYPGFWDDLATVRA